MTPISVLLSDTDAAGLMAGLAALGMFWMMCLAFALIIAISLWKVFTKAGKPGWAALIPIYNVVVLCEIAGKPQWWALLYFIPLVDIVVAVIVCLGVARRFGKGDGFGLGLAFLGFIFYPILAFGEARYQYA